MAKFEELYAKAVEDGTLPGYALLAGDKDGECRWVDIFS
jgi:hypothetical protein